MAIGYSPNAAMIHMFCDQIGLEINTEIQIADADVEAFNAEKRLGSPCHHCGKQHVLVAHKPKFSRASEQ